LSLLEPKVQRRNFPSVEQIKDNRAGRIFCAKNSKSRKKVAKNFKTRFIVKA